MRDALRDAIIYEIARRHAAVRAIDPSTCDGVVARAEIVQQQRRGPRYSPKDWFGESGTRDARRLLEEIDHLAERGLVEKYGRHGRRMTHLKLTDAGQRIANEIITEMEPTK